MAGGDGSQALVASVASRHGVPHVCIPAGTRNHFALDLGLDRDDVVGALDAFGDAVERRIDLATVNGSVFVNNASMGIYAKIVQSPEYRDAKLRTAAAMLPDMLGSDAEPFDLRFTGPGREEVPTAHMILVSNDPYELDHLDGARQQATAGPRHPRDRHGAVANAIEAVKFAELEAAGRVRSFSGWSEWDTPRLPDRLERAGGDRDRRRGDVARAAAGVRVAPRGAANPHPHQRARRLSSGARPPRTARGRAGADRRRPRTHTQARRR